MTDKKQIVIKKQVVEDNLSNLLDTSDGIYAALLSSVDGHALAKKSVDELSETRLAAMTSSCLALGEKIAIEAQQTGCNFVIIQNTDGFLVMRRVDKKLVITTLANKNINLGMVMSATNSVADSLEKEIRS
ncbi:roadblock/LC7 domain-containing protein [Sessilibacter corallicola]|uniref:Roadblock/LAMTOR2 domain-containing protein n=1 Tax=Sessilibacter corallicola TaxID=2904075 RepID=A0ABQ0AE58_9GAMM|nr:roadblock/LC7 domain-containing protein [Sessilibacter corallicola]MCE2028345.1 roadblock/LC7 domain-containing protein [Sessilibacter corallicola]